MKRAWTRLSRALARGLDPLFPWRCSSCGTFEATRAERRLDGRLCAGCAERLRLLRGNACQRCAAPQGPHLDAPRRCRDCREMRFVRRTLALLRYEGVGRQLVHRFKYEADTGLTAPLARALARRVRQASGGSELVTAVPMHWRRRLSRGFDHAAELARALAPQLDLPLALGALRRPNPTPPLHELRRSERQHIVEAAFVADPKLIQRRRVLLVDDVRTSGATLSACARALREAGARSVDAAVIAVTPRGPSPTAPARLEPGEDDQP